MATWITKLDATGDGPRVAVKDIIDVEGVPTSAGSRAVERTAAPAVSDSSCLKGARAAGARIVGKANLHELAMLPFGTNPWFGTPVNPLGAELIPGGSSSGCAVAVASGEADVAFGSDTGGSVRVPSACCGTAGLKTTYGRVPVDGVWPLAPSLDTIGPMAADIGGLVLGMELLEPGFTATPAPARTIGRLRTSALPEIEAAIDDALREAELDVVVLDWDDFVTGTSLFGAVYFEEVWQSDHHLLDSDPQGLGDDIAQTLAMADIFRPAYQEMVAQLPEWRQRFLALFDQVELLALPTLPAFPARIDDVAGEAMFSAVIDITSLVSLFNVAGTPCTAQPVPTPGSRFPASLQLVGPLMGEELLLSTAARIEAATR